jgi:ribosomal-protein-serine acetyltransferase
MLPHRISESLVLKPIQPHHAAEMFAVIDRNREFLKQWLGWLDTTRAVEDSQKFIQELQASYLESGAFTCGIWYDDQFCGLVGYNTIDWELRSANLGYWIAEKFQNLGIMTQCCRAFIDHSFNEYQLNRIEIHIAVENHRSQALAERLGFTKEKVVPNAEWLYDHNVDHIVNSLTRN